MDTHKKEHKIALHYPGQEEIVSLTVKNTSSEISNEISKMVKRILRKAPGEVRFCYEAGVCGFNLKGIPGTPYLIPSDAPTPDSRIIQSSQLIFLT